MPKMLNSRPTVSGHKRKVAPITSRVLMPIQVSRSICLSPCMSDCLPQFVIDAQLGVAARNGWPGLTVLTASNLAMSVIFISIELSSEMGTHVCVARPTRATSEPQECLGAARTKANLWFGANEIQRPDLDFTARRDLKRSQANAESSLS